MNKTQARRLTTMTHQLLMNRSGKIDIAISGKDANWFTATLIRDVDGSRRIELAMGKCSDWTVKKAVFELKDSATFGLITQWIMRTASRLAVESK